MHLSASGLTKHSLFCCVRGGVGWKLLSQAMLLQCTQVMSRLGGQPATERVTDTI